MTYYNEHDKFLAKWLDNLQKAGKISGGTVDGRDIQSVRGTDLTGIRRAHFFAGIGGWDLALDLAGWNYEKDGVVWTGSCPCQPFSIASPLRKGVADERHLWPEFCRLISECRPPTIFGEQVGSPSGRDWLLGVQTDLEALGYRVAAADLCVAGVGAPHIRQRLYWVADRISDTQPIGLPGEPRRRAGSIPSERCPGDNAWWPAEVRRWADGTTRRIEPGTSPLAHGVPGRVGLLRGYGNAIVPQVAAEFVMAYMEEMQ